MGAGLHRSFGEGFAVYGGFSIEEWGEVESAMLALLETAPLTRKELHAKLPELSKLQWAGWGQDVKGLAFRGRLVFANNDGATRFRATRLEEHELNRDGASAEFLVRYFGAFGPATFQDFLYWSQMPMAQAKAAMKAASGRLIEVEVAGLAGKRYVASPSLKDARAPSLRGVRLLPKFDPLTLAHRDKGLLFSSDTAKKVFRPAGQIEATVLAGGEIVGTWRLKRGSKSGEIAVDPFAQLSPKVRSGIEKEAARMAKSLGLERIDARIG